MMKRYFALLVVAGAFTGAGCGSHDESARTMEAITVGSGSGPGSGSGSSSFPDAGTGTGAGSDAGMGPGPDAGTGAGSDAGMGPGSDAGMGPGSDAGAGPAPDGGVGPDPCGDGRVDLDPYSAQYNLAGDTVVLDPHSLSGTAPYSFSASGLPPGLSIHAATGRITGTLGTTSYTGSPYRVTISITDSSSPPRLRSVSFHWRIDRRALPGYTSSVGDVVNASLPPSCTYPCAYTVTGLPPGLRASMLDGSVTGTISAVASPGPYTVTVSTGGTMASGSYSFLWWVLGPSLHVASEPADQSSWEGESVSLRLPLPGGAPGFAYQPTNLPPGLVLDAPTRTILGTLAPGAQAGSPYSVTVRAVSSNGVTTTFAFRWTVYTDVAPVAENHNRFGPVNF